MSVTKEEATNLSQVGHDEQEETTSGDETASQTTEDDPEIPDKLQQQPTGSSKSETPQQIPPPPLLVLNSVREGPKYRLRYTMRGHTKSISAVKFSPDGALLASCGEFLSMDVL